jgi:hypothetical protein
MTYGLIAMTVLGAASIFLIAIFMIPTKNVLLLAITLGLDGLAIFSLMKMVDINP